MRCKECKYMKAIKSRGMNIRYNCYCYHPNQRYIINYFAEKRIKKAIGFIDFSEPYIPKPKIKNSPKWCPLREVQEGGEKNA